MTDRTVTGRELEAAAIFGSHGIADGVTTAWAAVVVGAAGEPNPLMAGLLEAGLGWAIGTMLLVVGLVAAAWPTLAERADLARWFPIALIAVGLLVALGNLVVVVAIATGWWV